MRAPDSRPITRFLAAAATAALLLPGCAGKKQPLDEFSEHQKIKITEKSAYVQADFDFWAASYEPTLDDLEALRAAWVEHGDAFPESKPIADIEKEVRHAGARVLLVALFMTAYENADLKDKSRGWAIHPVPKQITELADNDVVLRRLMPVKNQWARYFLLRYSPEILGQASQVVVSNATSRVELKRH